MPFKDPEVARAYRKNYYKKHGLENKEKMKASGLSWRAANREKTLKTTREWRRKHKIRLNLEARRNRHKLKWRLGGVLGGLWCCKCGEYDIRCLQFDHIHGKERNGKGINLTMLRYYTLHHDEAKFTLQVLCANCNWRKVYSKNEREKGRACSKAPIQIDWSSRHQKT